MFKTILTKFTKYLLTLINTFEDDGFDNNKHKSIKKSRNKMIKILTKLKSRNLFKFKFENLYRSKIFKILINKSNFLIFNTRASFTKFK